MKNQIKTFEEACKLEGLDPKKVIPTFEFFQKKEIKAMQSHAKLLIIVKAANKIENKGKEWVADFTDRNQSKFEPWLIAYKKEDGSSGFRFGDYDYWRTVAAVGSRLCFISSELCEYISNQFIDLYEDYMIK